MILLFDISKISISWKKRFTCSTNDSPGAIFCRVIISTNQNGRTIGQDQGKEVLRMSIDSTFSGLKKPNGSTKK